MTELALNILDIVNNSTRAGAKNVDIGITVNLSDDVLDITITDDGCGMSREFLKTVTDPFSTTRTTRKVGMGISLFKMEAEISGGSFDIESEQGKGTKVFARFILSSIDRPPMGDLGSTVTTLIGGAPETEFTLNYLYSGNPYIFSTKNVRDELCETDLSDPVILNYLKDMINENIFQLNGGNII